jgi:hypothetical protein
MIRANPSFPPDSIQKPENDLRLLPLKSISVFKCERKRSVQKKTDHSTELLLEFCYIFEGCKILLPFMKNEFCFTFCWKETCQATGLPSPPSHSFALMNFDILLFPLEWIDVREKNDVKDWQEFIVKNSNSKPRADWWSTPFHWVCLPSLGQVSSVKSDKWRVRWQRRMKEKKGHLLFEVTEQDEQSKTK